MSESHYTPNNERRTMGSTSTANRYGSIAIALHWATAGLIFALLLTGWLSANSDQNTIKIALLRVHVPLGLLVLFLTLARIAWWGFFDKKPKRPVMPAWQSKLSTAVHILLYLGVLGLSSSGIGTMVLSGAGAIVFAGADPGTLPDFWEVLPRTPHAIVSRILVGLLFLHMGAALYHQYVKRDGLLARMWFNG